jgi:hypothetical protein
MDPSADPVPDESKRLQRCINDLTCLLALPTISNGGDPSHVVRTLIDALLGMLRLDFIYARFTASSRDAPIQMLQVRAQELAAQPEEVGHAICQWLAEEPSKWPRSVKIPLATMPFRSCP